MVHSDHRPLVSIIQKPISLALPCLKRMLLRLRTYDVVVHVYVGVNQVLLADTLSRLIRKENIPTPAVSNLDVTIAQVLKECPCRLQTFQEESTVDADLNHAVEAVHQHRLAQQHVRAPGLQSCIPSGVFAMS